MMNTATRLSTGPFGQFFGPRSTLYALDPALSMFDGRENVSHVIVTALEEDAEGPAETFIIAAENEQGDIDSRFYITYGSLAELEGTNPAGALDLIGYREVS
jgi:hypothetical protein